MDTNISQETMNKFKKLKKILSRMGKVAIGFSGGVDSTFLLKVAVDTLGEENVMAVTSSSETHPEKSLEEAKQLAGKIGALHKVIHTPELDNIDFKKNDRLRCYYCKRILFSEIKSLAVGEGFAYVVDGSNYDDMQSDYRPGRKATSELGVRSPLEEAEMTKIEIRKLSRSLGLPTWEKASFACLATRFPYGEEITEGKLVKIGRAEEYLKSFSFKQLRARQHDENTIRIEVTPEDMDKLMANRQEIVEKLKEIGYIFVALDLEGYRTGSMNVLL
ncbi:MAG: ATP-dependent sacrificial sulfur transferase LarE [Halanaerobiales bacterium]